MLKPGLYAQLGLESLRARTNIDVPEVVVETDFLQLAHSADERYTVRDGINVARFAIKLKSLATQRTHETEALEIAVTQVLGEEALRYVRSTRPTAI